MTELTLGLVDADGAGLGGDTSHEGSGGEKELHLFWYIWMGGGLVCVASRRLESVRLQCVMGTDWTTRRRVAKRGAHGTHAERSRFVAFEEERKIAKKRDYDHIGITDH